MSGRTIYHFEKPLVKAVLLQRYKRFLADVSIPGAVTPTTVYCPNTGSMYGIIRSETSTQECALSQSSRSGRKYEFTLEMIAIEGVWVGIHSSLANKMVKNAFEMGLIEECAGYSGLSTEVKVADSRIDFELVFGGPEDWEANPSEGGPTKKRRKSGTSAGARCPIGHRMLVEVKSVTLARQRDSVDGSESIAEFPDTVSDRASKHAETLTAHAEAGGRAAILFLIQRGDANSFTTSLLDPAYQRAVHRAEAAGVQILPYTCNLCPDSGRVVLGRRLPFLNPLAAPSPPP